MELKPEDEVKFVISDRHDYEWALGIVRERFDAKTKNPVFGSIRRTAARKISQVDA